jgi:hypothetical protein
MSLLAVIAQYYLQGPLNWLLYITWNTLGGLFGGAAAAPFYNAAAWFWFNLRWL